MNKVAIMTDTICGISPDAADELGVKLIPLHVAMDGVSYLDTEVDKTRLYEQLAQRNTLPTTSAPSAAQYLGVYRELSQRAEAIVHICYTSWIGMGYEQATRAKDMARRELPKTKIETIDTHTELGAQLLCVLEAARLVADGKSFAEIVDGVNRLVPKLNLLYILDTVYYIGRGGRMGRADDWADSVLDVKSVLELDASTGGAMTPVTRARTKAKAIEKSVAIVKERNGNGKLHVVVSHDDVPEEAEQLKQQLLSQLPVSEIHIAGVSPVNIVHNGPGALRVGWYSEEPGG